MKVKALIEMLECLDPEETIYTTDIEVGAVEVRGIATETFAPGTPENPVWRIYS